MDPRLNMSMIKDARWGRLPRQPVGLLVPPTHMRLKPNPLIQSGLKGPARVIPAATHIRWASAHHAAIVSTSTCAQASVSFGIARAVRVWPCTRGRSIESIQPGPSLARSSNGRRRACRHVQWWEQHQRWLHGGLTPCVCVGVLISGLAEPTSCPRLSCGPCGLAASAREAFAA
jgi:hypothetical protein